MKLDVERVMNNADYFLSFLRLVGLTGFEATLAARFILCRFHHPGK